MSSVEDEHVTIEMHDPSDEFVECWQAAGSHCPSSKYLEQKG